MPAVQVIPFAEGHADGVAAVAAALGWPSFSDADVVRRACLAPGVTAWVACEDESVVGFAQACGDGVLQSFLSQLGVVESHRRQGIARRLVEAAFAATDTQRMDLVTDDAHDFYRAFAHREKAGFRLYPGHDA